MAKTTHNLSALQLRRWISSGEPVAKSDGDGLTFTLSSAGTASWVLRYRNQAGRRKELTLGNYPDIGLAAARELGRSKRAAIDAGQDPAASKQEDRSRSAAAMTMPDLVADYRAKALQPGQLAGGTIKYRVTDFESVILPRFRSWEVRKVTSLDVVQMLKDAKRTWSISKRVLTSMSKLMDHAMGIKVIPSNPCTGIKLSALMGPKPAPRRRVMLDTAELRSILPTIDQTIGRNNGLAFRILLATCVRGVELVKTRKEHVDLDSGSWWVPEKKKPASPKTSGHHSPDVGKMISLVDAATQQPARHAGPHTRCRSAPLPHPSAAPRPCCRPPAQPGAGTAGPGLAGAGAPLWMAAPSSRRLSASRH